VASSSTASDLSGTLAAPAAASLSSPECSLRRPARAGFKLNASWWSPPHPRCGPPAAGPGASASVTERQPDSERPAAAASRHYIVRAVKPAAAQRSLYPWWTILGRSRFEERARALPVTGPTLRALATTIVIQKHI
jgi:hypothetical protein